MARRTFGNTWWGKAWVEALELRAAVDPNRLPRGRTYARKGTVSGLKVAGGEVVARVRGSRPVPYKVTIRMREFSGEQWDALLTTAGARLGHVAALLDGELPAELAESARAAGADLLPGPGDLTPKCSCPDSANPCKHVAAVYYLVADEVDADPFVLFLLRGRAREEVLAELRARRAPARPARSPGKPARLAVDPGLAPREAFTRRRASVPRRQPVPDGPGPPAVYAVDPPAATGWRSGVLSALAADAASRAWDLLADPARAAEELSLEEDLARRAGARPGDLGDLATASGVSPQELRRWAEAWQEAGRGGVRALRESWQPAPAPMERAKAELTEGLPGEVKVWRNRLTQGPLQLRLGRDGRWYRFVRDKSGWRLDGPGAERPADVGYPAFEAGEVR